MARYYLIIIICYLQIAYSQSADKIFESINHYDYYHTKVYAHKLIKKKKKLFLANYALAYTYFQNFKPFYNLDSADKYIHKCIANNMHTVIQAKQGRLDSVIVQTLYDSISYKQFEKIQQSNIPYVYDRFIQTHPYLIRTITDRVYKYQNKMIVQYAEGVNNSDTTLHLIKNYPNHPEKNYLVLLSDKQRYNERTSHRSKEEYVSFLLDFPKNQFRNEALQHLLNLYITNKDIKGLEFYVEKFKDAKYYSAEAWKWLFFYSVPKYNNAELEKFINHYPQFPFKQNILHEMEMSHKELIPHIDSTEKAGFIDTLGTWIIPPKYDAITPFNDNIAVVSLSDSVWFINKDNQPIFSKKFKDAFTFFNGYAPVFDGNQWYFINRLGARQPQNFDEINERSSDNNYVVKKNNLYGLVDYKGDYILNSEYEKLGDFENHYAYYIKNGLYGIIFSNGYKTEAKYQWISNFNDSGFAIVKQNANYGIINLNDTAILQPIHDLIFYITKNIYLCVKNKKYGFYDASKKCFLYFMEYDFQKNTETIGFTNGYYFKLLQHKKTYIGNENGYINKKKIFQEVVVSKYFTLCKNKKWAYSLNLDKPNLKFIYDEVIAASNGQLILKAKNNFELLDTTGKIAYTSEDEIKEIKTNYYFVDNSTGGLIIDNKGKVLLNNIQDYVVSDKYIIITRTDNTIRVIF